MFKRPKNRGTKVTPLTIDPNGMRLGQVWLATPNRIVKVHIVSTSGDTTMVMIVDPQNHVERDTLYMVNTNEIVEVQA